MEAWEKQTAPAEIEEKILSKYPPYRPPDLISCSIDIDESEIELKEVIGKGNFSIVYKAIYKKKCVAVKVLQQRMNQKILNEIEVLK